MATAEKSAAHPERPTSSVRMEVGAAESRVPEASHQAGQFGPLPLVIRPSAPTERKVRRVRRGSGNAGRRAIVLCLLTGIFLAAGLAWALTSVFAQQPAGPKPATSPPGKNAPAAPLNNNSPQLTALPALDQRGFLHIAGFFPTRPQQINFELLFQNVANQWRLFGISIATPDVPSAAAR